jgi:hypothetical protein
MKLQRLVLAASTLILSGGLAMAQQQSAPQQQGPVAAACTDDIARYCAGMEHGQGEIRTCLEDNKDQVSPACRTALESTRGPGGMGQGMGRMRQRMGQGGMGQGMMGQGMMGQDMMDQGMMGQQMGRGMMGRGMRHDAMHMRIMFILIDADGDGALSLEEVQSAHARIFAHVDADKDDKVTYDELVAFFRGGPGMQVMDDGDDTDE